MDRTEIEKHIENTGVAKVDTKGCLIFTREAEDCDIKILIPREGWVSDRIKGIELREIYRIRHNDRNAVEIALKKIKDLENEIKHLKKQVDFYKF